MSILDDGAWRSLPDADKRHLRDRLAEECARRGIPINDTTSPGILALRHEPAVTVQRPHLELIDRELTKLLSTPNAKLMIWTPPQVGKSMRVSRWFPFWWLTHRPRDRVILASYAASLANTHGAACRDLVESHGLTYGLRMRDDENTRANWSLTTGGGMRSVGTKGGLTGHPMNCLTGETTILTREGPQRIQDIVAAQTFPEVLSYNHTTHAAEWRPVIATQSVPRRPIVEVHTATGRTIRCTRDHRIYTHRGYVDAGSLRPGDRLTIASAPDLLPMQCQVQPEEIRRAQGDRQGADRTNILQHHLLPGNESISTSVSGLPMVPQHLHGSKVRMGQESPPRNETHLLLEEVHRPRCASSVCTTMPRLLNADGRSNEPLVLHTRMSGGGEAPEQEGNSAPDDEHVLSVRSGVPSEILSNCVLRSGLRERSTLESDDRERELSVPRRNQLCDLVSEDAATDPRARRASVRGMSRDATSNGVHPEREIMFPFCAGDSSHQREAAGQPVAESGHALCDMPCAASSQTSDTVSVVREVRGEPVTVYDLQVEGNSNFFADEVLVHNCGIIDDPYADRAAADSPLIRERVWEWYSSAYTTRKAPGAREVIVMTRWHPLDLCGRLLERDGRTEEGGEWTVLHLPALAVAPDPAKGIYADPLGREPGDPLTHPVIDLGDIDSLADHWRRKKKGSTSRDWNAVYQGSPFDSEGALLTETHIRDATADLTLVTPRIAGVGIDPSGGGRDTAGIVGGILGSDGKFYWTHNRTARMTSDRWSREACLLADEMDADRFVIEVNYGGDQATTLLKQAWDALQREGAIDKRKLCPRLVPVHSRKSKLLRAEPIAQAILTQRAWFGRDPGLSDFKSEWQLWEPGSTWSPGALDAGVHLATDMLPPINAGSSVSSAAKRSRSSVTGTSSLAARRTR